MTFSIDPMSIQPCEYIGDDGIPALRGNGHDIPVLTIYPVKHSARGVDFESIIIPIDVNFTAENEVNGGMGYEASFKAGVTVEVEI